MSVAMREDGPRPQDQVAPVLDIGDGAGALLVETEPWLLGAEIQAAPIGHEGQAVHAEVHPRRDSAGVLRCTALLPALPAGDYALSVGEAFTGLDVTVREGAVTSIRLAPRFRAAC